MWLNSWEDSVTFLSFLPKVAIPAASEHRVEPDRKDFLARCDVVTDRDVRLLRYRDVVAPSHQVTNFQSWISAFIARSATSLATVSVQPGIFLVVIGFSN